MAHVSVSLIINSDFQITFGKFLACFRNSCNGLLTVFLNLTQPATAKAISTTSSTQSAAVIGNGIDFPEPADAEKCHTAGHDPSQ